MICATGVCANAWADVLTEAEKLAHLERLEKLKAAAENRADSKFRSAISAFNSAMGSDAAALELYLKCVEKVDFEEQKRKASEFRDWRREQADNLARPSFRLALRHQLRWLVTTLEAASGRKDREEMARTAQQAIDGIVNDARQLKDQQGLISQSVTETVFAKAYGLEAVKASNWPLAPIQAVNTRDPRSWKTRKDEVRQMVEEVLEEQDDREETAPQNFNFDPTGQLGEIYEQVLLPPHRGKESLDRLKAGWMKRLQQEDEIYRHWSDDPNAGVRIGTADALRSPIYAKYLTEGLPGLQWQMEVDLFRNGDEVEGAKRLLAHLEKHLALPASKEWSEQLQGLLSAGVEFPGTLSPPPAPAAADEEEIDL